MTIEEKNELLKQNWVKICNWVKEYYANVFPTTKRFHFPHNAFYWVDFVVMPNGDARIYYGDHGSDHPERVLTPYGSYEGSNGRFQIGVKTIGDNSTEEDLKEWNEYNFNRAPELIEKLIAVWTMIKAEVIREGAFIHKIETFEP